MNKTPFTYQRWLLRVFCAVVIDIFAIFSIYGLLELTRFTYYGFWFRFFMFAIVFAITHFYFKLTKHSKWFICEGNYWVEDGTVFIETRKKTYSLNNVTGISGTTFSFWGYNKSGMLKFDYNRKTLTLMSLEVEDIKSFSESGLYGLFETTRENNPELKKGDTYDFCYEVKK